MKIFELFEHSSLQGADNLTKIAEAVKNKTAARLMMGESVVTLGYSSAKYVYGLYETARISGNADKFMKALSEGVTTLKENTDTLSHIISRFKHEAKSFMQGDDLDTDLYHALYDYYSDHGEIPYGIAKARDGDPFEWVTMRFDRDVNDYLEPEPTLPESIYSDAELYSLGESKKVKEASRNPWLDLGKDDRPEPGKKRSIATGEIEYKDGGQIHRSTKRYSGSEEEVKTKEVPGEETVKRGRGRPRVRALPDPNAEKRGRGRPRTRPEVDTTAPKRGRGRPKKVREWIETLRYVAESA